MLTLDSRNVNDPDAAVFRCKRIAWFFEPAFAVADCHQIHGRNLILCHEEPKWTRTSIPLCFRLDSHLIVFAGQLNEQGEKATFFMDFDGKDFHYGRATVAVLSMQVPDCYALTKTVCWIPLD